MIRAGFRKDDSGKNIGFTVSNHGDSKVCAAVSALAINCVNSLEELVGADIYVDASPDGGKLICDVAKPNSKALLLLDSLELGLRAIEAEYPRQIRISEVN